MPTEFVLAPLNPDSEKESLDALRAVSIFESFRTADMLSLCRHYTENEAAAKYSRVKEYWSDWHSQLETALALRHWSRS